MVSVPILFPILLGRKLLGPFCYNGLEHLFYRLPATKQDAEIALALQHCTGGIKIKAGGLIILSGEYVYAAESMTKHDGTRNMNIGVEPKGHYGWARGRRRAETAEGPAEE